MKNITQKVIVLENLKSPYISRAILFLNDASYIGENQAVIDAENIVSEYLDKEYEENIKIYNPIRKKRKRQSHTLLFLMLAAVFILLGVAVLKIA